MSTIRIQYTFSNKIGVLKKKQKKKLDSYLTVGTLKPGRFVLSVLFGTDFQKNTALRPYRKLPKLSSRVGITGV